MGVIETPETKPPVQYALIRKDLPADKQAIMLGHATRESILVAPSDKRTILRALYVENESELTVYRDLLVAKGFHVGLVREPAHPYNGAAMALGTDELTERVSALSKIVYHLERATFGVQRPEFNVAYLLGLDQKTFAAAMRTLPAERVQALIEKLEEALAYPALDAPSESTR